MQRQKIRVKLKLKHRKPGMPCFFFEEKKKFIRTKRPAKGMTGIVDNERDTIPFQFSSLRINAADYKEVLEKVPVLEVFRDQRKTGHLSRRLCAAS